MVNIEEAIAKATNFGSNLKLSYLTLARVLKIDPEVLAVELYNDKANNVYKQALILAMVQAKVEKEAIKEKEAEEKAKAESK